VIHWVGLLRLVWLTHRGLLRRTMFRCWSVRRSSASFSRSVSVGSVLRFGLLAVADLRRLVWLARCSPEGGAYREVRNLHRAL